MKRIKKLYSFILFVFIVINSLAQYPPEIIDMFTPEKLYAHNIQIIQDEDITDVFKQFLKSQIILTNEGRPGVNLYRIRIYRESVQGAMDKAYNIRLKAKNAFPEYEVNVEHDGDWVTTLGFFRTLSQATKVKNKVVHQFPDAYIVTQTVSFTKVKLQENDND